MQQLKEKIKNLLRWIGLYDTVYTVYMRLRKALDGNSTKRKQAFFRSFNQFKAEVNHLALPAEQLPTVVFFGYLLDSRKPLIYQLAREIAGRDDADALLCTNSSTRPGDEEAAAALLRTFDSAKVLTLPVTPASASYLTLPITQEMLALYEEKPYLKDALANARESFPKAGKGYLETLMIQYYQCFDTMLNRVNISAMVIWNAFKYHHMILTAMCKERGIRLLFAEFGAIPGTVVFDEGGQMGESWPATHPEQFSALDVTEEECAHTARILAALRKSGLNRNVQPETRLHNSFSARLKPGRPILLFAGQCDRDSGMIPYTETARHFHSPSFESTMDAVIHVAAIAKANDWNLIFKPHPTARHEAYDKRLPEHVIPVTDVNINEIIDLSDVVITTLSSTVYVSLIRETPCVMLGYNQIHAKNCAYEALEKASIEPVLQQAVAKGYTEIQKAAFVRHVAQMGKYYLYSDGRQQTGLSFGRGADEAFEMVHSLLSYD